MNYSIIIPTLKNLNDIQPLIEEIKKNTVGDYELITTCENMSAAKNRNKGLNLATKDYIIMIDDDVSNIPYEWNINLCKPFMEYNNIAIISARLINADKQASAMSSGNYDMITPIISVHRIPSACIAFKKTHLRFDEAYIGSGYEDTDFCEQFKKLDLKYSFIINNNVKVVHKNEAKNQRGHEWAKNKQIFFNKWGHE